MSEDVLLSTTWLDGLRWPSTCVRCGAPVEAASPFAVPACPRHARSEAVARWILSPTPGVLALRVPVFLGFGWLVRFVASTLHKHADWSTELAKVDLPMQALFAYALVGTIALLWAEATASLRVMYPDAAKRTLLLRFRRADEAREFRALNADFVVANARPTSWWLRDAPWIVLAVVTVLALALEWLHPLKAH
jgi:hypothetical protein